jgi:phosphate acetyltransferase
MLTQLSQLLDSNLFAQPIAAAVVHPTTDIVLQSCLDAQTRGIINPILVGRRDKIEAAAHEANLDISGLQLIDAAHSHDAVALSAQLVRDKKAALIIKGSVHTDELMGVLVDKSQNLRTDRRMSHVWLMQSPTYHKLLTLTDCALNVLPDLLTKRDILQNAIDFAHALGIEQPKVAILSAVEEVKPQLPSTIDAAALCKMADRGQITGAILDGPLAFDNAISQQSADIKHIESPVTGDVDILLVPDLEAGNMLGKQLIYLGKAKAAGLVMGSKVPIVLTSRSDDELDRLYSIALGAFVAQQSKQGR